MTRQITTVVADVVYEDLKAWAKEEGRPLSNLTSYLLESALRAKYPEKYPSANKPKND